MSSKIYFSLFLLFSCAFVLLTVMVFQYSCFNTIDQSVYSFASSLANPYWIKLVGLITFLGDARLLFSLLFIVMIFAFSRAFVREGTWYLLCFSIGLQFNASLKVFFERERPQFFDPSILISSYAYPSGHVLGAFLFYTLTLWMLSKIVPRCFNCRLYVYLASFIIILVGVSRIQLGVHWFSDVLAGILLGCSLVSFYLFMAQKFNLFKPR